MYILFAIVGIAGSVVTKIQSPLTCVSDLFTCSKFILGYLATRLYFKGCNPNLLKRSVSTITKLLVVIFFVLAIHDEFMTPFFGIFDNRLFGKSIELFYPHPTYLAAACIVFLLVLATTNGPENNIIYMVMASTIVGKQILSNLLHHCFVLLRMWLFLSHRQTELCIWYLS